MTVRARKVTKQIESFLLFLFEDLVLARDRVVLLEFELIGMLLLILSSEVNMAFPDALFVAD